MHVVPVLLILLGAGIRLRQWWGERSLWLDEALVARSLISRDYAELVAEPLQGDQAGPVLWLWATRLSSDLLGEDERALRLVALLAGLTTMVLAWRLARRLLPDVVVPVAVAVVALSPSLVYFSNEVKPYALDTAVVLGLLLLGRRPRWLAVAGVVAVWASYAAVFALAGLSVVLVLVRLRREGVRAAVRAAGLLSAWLISLGLAYVLVLHRHRESEVLSSFWAGTFPDGPGDLPAWLLRRAVALIDDPLELVLWPISLLLLAFGAMRLLRSRPTAAALALSPVPFAVLAAALSVYPFAGRLALWLVPLAAIALAAALPARGRLRLLTVVAVAAVAGPMAMRTLPLAIEVQERNELRPVLEQLKQQRQPGDLVLVDNAAQAPFAFYAPRTGLQRDGVVLLASPDDVGGSCNDEVALRTGRFPTQRVWVVFAHELADGSRLGTREDLIARIDEVSNVADTIERTGAKAVLFDPAAPETSTTAVRNPERCLSVVRTG